MAKNACSQEKTNYLIDYKIKQQKEIKQKPVVQLVKGKHHQMLWLVRLTVHSIQAPVKKIPTTLQRMKTYAPRL